MRRGAAWIAVSIAGLSAGACGRETATASLANLKGRIHHAAATLVLPADGWQERKRRLVVEPAKPARLLVDLSDAGDAPLRLRFVPARRLAPLTADWDGAPLGSTTLAADGAAELTVPAGRLTRGAHRLRLVTAAGETAPALLRRISWSRGGESGDIDSGALEKGRWAQELLAHEVGGGDEEKLGGLVAFGPHRLRAAVAAEQGAVLRLTLRALAAGRVPVAVTARLGGRERELWRGELSEGERRPLRIVLPRGTTGVELRGEAARADDAVAWGELAVLSERARVPLVLLVTLDTTRRDALGAYGRRPSPTPNLDRLAAEAVVYTRASSTTSWTLPAHASIFTGQAPSVHAAGVTLGELPADRQTLARLLATRYRTIGLVGGPLVRPAFGVARGFGIYRPARGVEQSARELTRAAIELLEESAPDPVFLFVNYFDAHWPYRPPEDQPASRAVASKLAPLPPDHLWRKILEGNRAAWTSVVRGGGALDPRGLAAMATAYLGEVEEIDRQFGVLLDYLRASGRYDPAFIVVAGDHGELLGEGGFVGHAYRLDPELTEVPLIVKFGERRAPRQIAELASLGDLFPTILHAAGAEAPPTGAIDLADLAGLARRRHVLFEEHRSPVHGLPAAPMSLGPRVVGLETADRRIVQSEKGEECRERVDGRWRLAPCPEPLRAALAEAFAALRAAGRAKGRAAELDAAEEARLRALGYL